MKIETTHRDGRWYFIMEVDGIRIISLHSFMHEGDAVASANKFLDATLKAYYA